MASNLGPGGSSYQQYDREIARVACDWLREQSEKTIGKPWTLFVSFVCPHFPLIAPEEFYDLYDPDKVPLPKGFGTEKEIRHPALKAFRSYMDYNQYFDEQKTRLAVTNYLGMVSFVDDLIGKVLKELKDSGLDESTRIIYSSDHGDNLGTNGFWGKSTFNEESAGIPLIMKGPDIDAGKRVETPVSLADLAPTLIEFNGESLTESEKETLPGSNLVQIAAKEEPYRVVLSEYHAIGSITGTFMIRYRNWKYIHYVGYPCQLYDMEKDPDELNDLGQDPNFKTQRERCHQKLLEICDPETVNKQAFSDQAKRVEELGGREAVLNRESIPFTPAPLL
jgi:choline-sulfatase